MKKAIYNGIIYNVIKEEPPYIILEGAGYTFKTYMENILFTDKPEDKLESKRTPKDVISPQKEAALPNAKVDKSLHIKEMPHVDTPDHKGFDFGFEKLEQIYPDENERKDVVIKMLSDILNGEKVKGIADGITIQLNTPEEVNEFKKELETHPIFPFFSEKLFNMSVDELISAAENNLSLVENETISIFSEENLKPIATDPDLVDAAKKVYSIFNNTNPKYRHRNPIYVGKFDANRFVGMMKNAVKDLQRSGQELSVPNFIHRLFEWFKQSYAKGKGRNVVGLDDLEKELVSKYTSNADEPKTSEEPKDEPELEPDKPEDKNMEDIKNIIRRLADEGKINNNKVSTDDIITVAPEADVDAIKNALESLGVEVEEHSADVPLEECGVTAAAGAGVADGTVNQATDGVQGIAIRPEKIGMSIKKRLEEEVGKIDFNKLIDETNVPLGDINPSKEPNQLKDKYELYKSLEKQKDPASEAQTKKVQKENLMGEFEPRKGLEGPFKMKNGKTYYYDPKEGKYYDPTTDIYVDNNDEEFLQLTGMKEEHRKKVVEEMRTKIKKLFDNINQDDVFEIEEESVDDARSELDKMINTL